MIQGCLSGGRAAVSRGDLTDTEWRILNPLLPDRGERGPAIADKRRTMNGILWVLRTGAPWRDLPERYGKWNSALCASPAGASSGCGMRYLRRWRALGLPPTRNMPSIPQLCGRTNMPPAQKGESKSGSARPLARRLLHENPPSHDPLTFDVTGGEVHEVKGYDALMQLHEIDPAKLIGDKGYDSDGIRNDLAERGIEPVIPPQSNSKTPIEYDREAYKRRNLIERFQSPQAIPAHRHPIRENRQSLPFDAMRRSSETLDQNRQHGLMPSEMKRLRQLEEENGKLKRIVADLALDKEMLQDVIRRKLSSLPGSGNWWIMLEGPGK